MDGEARVSKTPVVRETLPLVPVIPTRYVPSSTFALAVNRSVDVPVPLAMNDGVNVAVTPVGKPNAERLTAEVDVAATVRSMEAFRSNLGAPGDTDKENPDPSRPAAQLDSARYTLSRP